MKARQHMFIAAPGDEHSMKADYDVAIIGAGHNGLVAASCLARAGHSVILLERRPVVGGACVTSEHIPGYKFSSCAFVLALFRPEILHALSLKDFGLVSYASDPISTGIFQDGTKVTVWRDPHQTLAGFGEFSRRDQEGFLELGLKLERFARITEPWLLRIPPTRDEVARAFRDAAAEYLYDELVELSIGDLVNRHFESPYLRAVFAFWAMTAIHAGPWAANSALQYSWHAWGQFEGSRGAFGFIRGGMGGLSEALSRCARHHGAIIKTIAPVAQILVRAGTAEGVVLESGEEIKAKVVLSNADPKRTLLRLLPPAVLPEDVQRMARQFDMRGSMARIHLASDELPRYVAFNSRAPGPEHNGHQLLGASMELFEQSWISQLGHELPERFVIEVITQSAHDPTLAPPGKHTVVLGIPHLPFELRGGWDARREEFADRVIGQLIEYAPNLASTITGRHVITPYDLERDWGLTEGNIYQGAQSLTQMFSHRPFPGWSNYRMPVRNLYLCGSGAHPGGGVTGAPGHNAATEVLRDLAHPPHDVEAWIRRASGAEASPGRRRGLSPGDLEGGA